jgi:hypothetical protein
LAATRSSDFIPLGKGDGVKLGRSSGWLVHRDGSGDAVWLQFSGPPDYRYSILLLPCQQPRPRKDREQNIRFAIVMTPVALAADCLTYATAIAMMPIVIPGIYLGFIPYG